MRPLGSIFEYQYFPHPQSPNPDTGKVFTYQVIGYDGPNEIIYPIAMRVRRRTHVRLLIDEETGICGGVLSVYHPDDPPANTNMDES